MFKGHLSSSNLTLSAPFLFSQVLHSCRNMSQFQNGRTQQRAFTYRNSQNSKKNYNSTRQATAATCCPFHIRSRLPKQHDESRYSTWHRVPSSVNLFAGWRILIGESFPGFTRRNINICQNKSRTATIVDPCH